MTQPDLEAENARLRDEVERRGTEIGTLRSLVAALRHQFATMFERSSDGTDRWIDRNTGRITVQCLRHTNDGKRRGLRCSVTQEAYWDKPWLVDAIAKLLVREYEEGRLPEIPEGHGPEFISFSLDDLQTAR